MRWISNTFDPNHPSAYAYGAGVQLPNETPAQSYANWKAWLRGKHLGRPQGTERYTVEELEAMGYVGVYVEEPNT